MEDLIANEGTIITITHNGFIKRTAVSSYRAQRRGGKGRHRHDRRAKGKPRRTTAISWSISLPPRRTIT